MASSTACPACDPQVVYEIRLRGELDEDWADWFGGGRRISAVAVHAALGETTIRGRVTDQCALFGLLVKIRDLGLPLLSVRRLESQV
jgi:hypothetical protein